EHAARPTSVPRIAWQPRQSRQSWESRQPWLARQPRIARQPRQSRQPRVPRQPRIARVVVRIRRGAAAYPGVNGGVAMMLPRPQRKISAAQTRACSMTTPARPRRHGSALGSIVTLAVLGLLVAAAPASAIIISAGPTYTPGNGWTCTAPAAGTEKLAGGGNYSCSGTASSFSNLYLGINRLTSSPFGDKMNSSGGSEPSGNEMFL